MSSAGRHVARKAKENEQLGAHGAWRPEGIVEEERDMAYVAPLAPLCVALLQMAGDGRPMAPSSRLGG